MPREKIDFRPNYAALNEHFPNREMLTVRDVMAVYGCSRASVYRNFPIVNGKISKAKLARLMCD